jgi:hypothetical protein
MSRNSGTEYTRIVASLLDTNKRASPFTLVKQSPLLMVLPGQLAIVLIGLCDQLVLHLY